jgi:hypothetical protein
MYASALVLGCRAREVGRARAEAFPGGREILVDRNPKKARQIFTEPAR